MLMIIRLEARVKGTLKLYNTMEAFQAVNRTQVLDQVRESIEQILRAQGNNEAAFRRACQFRMLVFADLKKHRFYCHVLHPAVFQPGLSFCFTLGETNVEAIRSWRTRSRQQDWGVLMPETADTPPVLIVLDPTEKMEAGDGVLGWPARNALFWCHTVLHRPHLDVCILRQNIHDSMLLRVSASQPVPDAALVVTGWERFDQGGAMLVDLAPLMDPTRLAHDAADLNLKLIKWRLLPELDLPRFSECRALLLGAGTLGCNVTRLLLVKLPVASALMLLLGMGGATDHASGQWQSVLFESPSSVALSPRRLSPWRGSQGHHCGPSSPGGGPFWRHSGRQSEHPHARPSHCGPSRRSLSDRRAGAIGRGA